MALQLTLRLKELEYSGKSIGRDIQFSTEVEDSIVNFRKKIQLSKQSSVKKNIKKILFIKNFSKKTALNLPIRITITELDPVYNDTGAGMTVFPIKIDVNKKQIHSFSIEVIAKQGSDKGKTAIFTLTLEAEIITVVSFQELWRNYPKHRLKHIDPKTEETIFNNHCAINVSHSLYHCNVFSKGFKGTKCWRCPTPNAKNKGIHAIRAQELAAHLKRKPFLGCLKVKKFSGKEFKEKVSGKTGIIFFKDYWQREGESGRTGDHIDLWNKNELASIGFFATWARTTFPSLIEELYGESDLRRSLSVWFWEIK